MKKTILPLALLLTSFLAFHRACAQANTTDSLAMVDLYNSTNGPGWTKHTNWLTSAPMYTWYGIFTGDSVHVELLSLANNNLVGTLPSSLGNLTSQGMYIDLSNNRLSGALPASLTNLPGEYTVSLFFSHNQLSGTIPNFQQTFLFLDLTYNDFTFATLEPYKTSSVWHQNNGLLDSVEADLPLILNGNTLSIAAGGTLSNNTYTWYKNGTVVATNTGDSTYTMTGSGTYGVSVTNSTVPTLTLYSIQNANTTDSLALIDLYNSTAGANWVKNQNWATSAPMASWNGVEARFGRVQTLYLPYNNLAGPLPASITNLTAATNIELSYNQLSGPIPSTINNLQSLAWLDLNFNQLSGTIPATLGNLTNLRGLILANNQLSGTIPPSLGSMTSLSTLTVYSNKLTGTIPVELGNLLNAYDITLSYNQLTDTIPASFANCSKLFELDLNNNLLTGQIPQSLGRIKTLTNLNLNDNHLTGTIPDSLCFLPQLAHFALFDNQLTGTLPDSLGNDANLIGITVENNNLSGTISANLSALYLDSFNISGNQYNFSVLPIPVQSFTHFIYAPQQNIPLTRVQANLSVSTGGNSAHSTYTLFKDGTSIATQNGDSLFTIGGLGNYNIVTTNTDAPSLTLYSDTLKLGLVLPDSSITTTQTISGTTAVDIDTSIFRIVTLTPGTGANGLTGSVTALESIDSSIQTFNGTPYVERHYDITPALNPSTSTATITLYYTQADFDTYNTYVTSHNINVPLLPTGGIDNGNILITQYHGSFTGTSSPANYSQGSEVIHPTVAWDATDNWWTVTFPVNGFSGFFLGTSPTPLPLTLLQFTGTPQGYDVNLKWLTTGEQNTRQFIVQHSPDGNSFDPIGTVAAKNTSSQNNYSFTDTHPAAGNNFYRLKMQDVNGQFTYSPIVLVTMSTPPSACAIYPNPATTSTSLLFSSNSPAKYAIEIIDLNGHILTQLAGTTTVGINKVDIDLHGYAPGTYTITLIDQEHGRQSIRLSKE
ncbi:MAG TPA: T9SS type A sorting domain-containing protein [Puia sp.]|jgi:Leucine-rich repeat (LRR) protein|nr:T9SS type A sorting domain-containing protein [Puia sp.]